MEPRRCVPVICAVALLAMACASEEPGGGSSDDVPTRKQERGMVLPTPEPPDTPPVRETNAEALERSGVLRTLDRTDTLAGIDRNNDGIRDDIEAYIASTFPDPAQQAAARQSAASLQAQMLVDKNDKAALRNVDIRALRAVDCLFLRFNGADVYPAAVSARLQALTANTKPRLLAYLGFSAAMDGTTGTLPEGDTCE